MTFRQMPKLTPQRAFRLSKGVPLNVAALYGGISMFRASLIERDPSAAKPGELERLKEGVEQAAKEHDRKLAEERERRTGAGEGGRGA